MAQIRLETTFNTTEIVVSGDLAFERGTYTLKITDKASGPVVADLTNRHIHLFRKGADGAWRTWRVMMNSATPAPAASAAE